jgi:DNA-binding HxlR family transcriptional regulator
LSHNPKNNMHHLNYEGPVCPVELCTEVITGKWKGQILYGLLDGSKRQGELRRFIPGATSRMLADQLAELESAGVVQRHVREGMPRRVEYSLTETGKTLKPVIKAAWQWGKSFLVTHPPAPSGDHSLEAADASPVI